MRFEGGISDLSIKFGNNETYYNVPDSSIFWAEDKGFNDIVSGFFDTGFNFQVTSDVTLTLDNIPGLGIVTLVDFYNSKDPIADFFLENFAKFSGGAGYYTDSTGNYGPFVFDINVTKVSIPEPNSVALIIIGLSGLVVCSIKHTQKPRLYKKEF